MQVEKMGWGPHDSSEPLVFSEQVMGVPYSQASATNSRQESRAESRAVSPTRDLAASQAKPALPRPSSAAASAVSVNASEAHGVTSGRIQALSETVKTINAQIEGLQAQTFSSADVCEGLTEKVRSLSATTADRSVTWSASSEISTTTFKSTAVNRVTPSPSCIAIKRSSKRP